MPEPGSTPARTVQLSDPVTVCLAGAAHKLRVARSLAADESPRRLALIVTAWAAVQDALDAREPTP